MLHNLPAGGAFGGELGVREGGLLADLAGAVELVHSGGAKCSEDGGMDGAEGADLANDA